MSKFKKLRKVQEMEKEEVEEDIAMASESDSSSSDDDDEFKHPIVQPENEGVSKAESKWKNRERVLIFCSRGADFRTRHLMNDLRTLMPHTKTESKLDKQTTLTVINEIAEMKNCSRVLYFENRKHKDIYLWMSSVGEGPSVKFLVHNIHTMQELKMTGNCLKASRPILSFDSAFDEKPHLAVIKEAIMQIFPTPNHHPRSQPFVDHVFNFSLTPDGKIWFRNFQIVDETLQLQEIGPRFVLELIRMFAGSFEGAVLYDNPDYESPNTTRRMAKQASSNKYVNRKLHEKALAMKTDNVMETFAEKVEDPVGTIYDTERVIDNEAALKIAEAIDTPVEEEKPKGGKGKKGKAGKRKAAAMEQ